MAENKIQQIISKGKGKRKKDEAHDAIYQRIRDAETYRDGNYQTKWEDYYRRYRSLPAGMREGSNIFVPETFMIVDVITNRTAESLFNTRPYVSVLPRDEVHSENARKVQELLDWQLADVINADRIFSEDIIPSWAIYGTVIVYDAWKTVKRKVKRPYSERMAVMDVDGNALIDTDTNMPVTETRYTDSEGKRLVRESEETVYDDPVLQNIDLMDFFVDPQATSLEDARYCGHREYRTKQDISHLEKTAGWKVDWDKVQPVQTRETSSDRRAQTGYGSGQDDTALLRSKKGLYSVRHYWELERHVVFVDEQCVLDEGNPYWHGNLPYKRACYISLPGEFYGMGLPEMLAALQDELNTVRNQRIDYNSLTLRRMWKMRKGCGLTANDLVWRQNGVLPVENMDDLEEIKVQQLPASAFSTEEGIKQDMKDVSGCHDILMGLAPSDETATTTMTKDNNASIRFKMGCTKLAEDILVPVSQEIISMDQQFMTEDKRVVLNPEAPLDDGGSDMISPLDVEGEFDLIYVGSSIDPLANKELTKEKLIQAIQLALQIPAYQTAPDKVVNMMLRLLQSMDIKAPDELIPEPQPPMPQPQPGMDMGMGLPPEAAMMAQGPLQHAPQIGMGQFDQLGVIE